MGFIHRIPALFAACFASLALILLTLSGTVCDFLKIQAKDGHASGISDSTSTYLGLICMNPIYDDVLKEDMMFIICRICLFASLAMGSFTCVLAWALSLFLSPTDANWLLLSLFSAVSAMLQMPIFMLFEADACTSLGSEQECVLSTGGFYLIISSTFWVVVAVATQFLDPPRWADELNAWKMNDNNNHRATGIAMHLIPLPDDAVDNDSQAPLLKAKKKTKNKSDFQSRFQAWASSVNKDDTAELPFNHTDSLSVDDQPNDTQHPTSSTSHPESNDNAINVLVVRPDVEQPGQYKNYQCTEVKDSYKSETKVDERRLTLAPPSMDGGSFDSSQYGPQQNLQLVVWEDSYDEQEAEEQAVHEIYADLENQKPRVAKTETQITICEVSATNQHAMSLDLDTPHAAPAELKNPMAPSNETQLVLAESSADRNQYAMYVKDKYASTSHVRHSAGKAKTKIMKTISDTLKKRPRVARTGTQKYSQMNDDDSGASLPLLPTEVVIRGYDNSNISEMLEETPTKHAEFPCHAPHTALNIPSIRSSSFDESAYPDPKLASMGSYESSSEEEEEPFPGISPAHSIEQDEASADSSNGSESDALSVSSESSDWRLRVAEIKAKSRSRRHRGYSSVQSLVSSTSLLETIIDEETDDDLRDHEYSFPYGLVRSMSAPTQSDATYNKPFQRHIHLDGHSTISTLGLSNIHQTSYSFSGMDLDSLQLAPYPNSSRGSQYYNEEENVGENDITQLSGVEPFDCYNTSIGAEVVDRVHTLEGASHDEYDAELEYLASLLSSPSDEMDALKPDPEGAGSYDDELSTEKSVPGGLLSSPSDEMDITPEKPDPDGALLSTTKAKKGVSPASPATTAPETPSPCRSLSSHYDRSIHDSYQHQEQAISFESEKSWKEDRETISFESEKTWKEDREIRGGIHATPVPDSPSGRQVSSVASIREKRIHRIKLEKASNNNSCVELGDLQFNSSATSSVVDELDLQLIDLLRDEGEYGPDEQSL